MKNIWLLMASICLLVNLPGCGRVDWDIPETGVSRELALQRKAELKDLSYHLRFRIPSEKSVPVNGHADILFSLTQPRRVVLDFRENPDKIRSIVVNGREVKSRIVNEHIIIPAGDTQAGANKVEIDFIAGDQSLNRNDEYLYTLLVPDRARTLFPCFDQPDLKALFSLQLEVPEEWSAVSNTLPVEEKSADGRKRIIFAETEPLSTYLFSFVAGRLERLSETRDGRTISLYHRETDSAKLAQAETIFDQVFSSLVWLEEYTGVPYPFAKYELIILPGFQYGGMEHTGATLYNDKRMFLNNHPSIEEELGRMELIAHETAHMWFGDYVTMAWFDDVWTKEVFANYFAARITEPRFLQVNHDLNALRNFYTASYSEDRTPGTNAIQQRLDNLNSAGLIYGQIIYNKAPAMMGMLVELMGQENFRKGIQQYLHTFAYSNATWADLVAILDDYTPEDLKAWSRVWVSEKGMPAIQAECREKRLIVKQSDPLGRDLVWPQDIRYMLVKDGIAAGYAEVRLKDSVTEVELEKEVDFALPNVDGKSYGYFLLDSSGIDFCLKHLSELADPVMRMSLIMSLNENRLNGRIDPETFAATLLKHLKKEADPLIIPMTVGYIKDACGYTDNAGKQEIEKALLDLSNGKNGPGCQLAAFRALLDIFSLPETVEEIYRVWDTQQPFEGLSPGEGDYIKMAYELALRLPEKSDTLIRRQAGRITNPDRKREFSFVSQAVVADSMVLDSLFTSLLVAENRRVEPWAAQMMYYLNHPQRRERAVKYIRPALEELQNVQRTGDIFFPKNWVFNCLRGHDSREAADIVCQFLKDHPDYPVLLKNKILQSSDHLYRKYNIQQP